MLLSTRDMARLGLLMLDAGVWNGKEIIPADWVRFMTSLVTPFRDMCPVSLRNYGGPERWGYGYLWWVWDQPAYPGGVYIGFLQGAYTEMGTGPSSYIAILSMIANANCAEHSK